MTVNEVPCWPKKPHYDQLKEGDKLREGDYKLDSYWMEWPGAETKTLKRGTDPCFRAQGNHPRADKKVLQLGQHGQHYPICPNSSNSDLDES
jgi:hypothetical protein